MIKALMQFLIKHSRRILFYALFGILGLLLILLHVNTKNWRPLKGKADWKATSNYSQAGAHFAIDQDLKTYWSSYFPMTFGMFFQIDIGKPSVINGLLLQVDRKEGEQPAEWIIRTSSDGQHWQTPISQASITYRSMLVVPFEAHQARYLQIIQTSIAALHSPWKISELYLLQPVVPWQFARSTFLLILIGWVAVIVVVLTFFFFRSVWLDRSTFSPVDLSIPRDQSEENVLSWPFLTYLFPILLIVIILGGWILRVYDLHSYELSSQEFRYFPGIAFEKYRYGEWLKAYFDYSKTGESWLTLFLIRWVSQFCESQLVALRVIPALFGISAAFLVSVVWRFFSQGRMVVWEAIIFSAFVSFSGWYVFLSRTGNLTVPGFFFLLLHLLVAYMFLYKQGSYLWIPVLTIVSGLGFFLHPTIGFLPFCILLFGGFHVLLDSISPGFLQIPHLRSFHRLKNTVFRLVLYAIAVLPLYGYWFMFVKQRSLKNLMAEVSLNSLNADGLWRALTFCGVGGKGSWIFWGFVLLGIVQIVSQRKHGEWFFSIQGGLFFLITSVCSSGDNYSSLSVVILLLFLFFVRGIYAGIEFFCPRLLERQRRLMYAVFLMAVTGYIGMFSINSLFWGQAVFPYAKPMFAEHSRAKQISTLVRSVKDDPNPCKTVIIRDQQLVDFYRSEYDIKVNFMLFAELQRLAGQGIFQTYIFTPISEATENQTVADFLNRYYTEVGESTTIALYQIKGNFHNTVQRYSARDLFFNTGQHVKDEHSSSGVVRTATLHDPAGLLAFGPFCRVCRQGQYTARFALRALNRPEDVVVVLEVVADNRGPVVRRVLKGSDFSASPVYQIFDLPFTLDMSDTPAYQMKRLQFFVHVTGKAEVRIDYVDLLPE